MTVSSPAGIAAAWSAASTDATRQSLALTFLKQQAEADQAVVALIAESAASTEAPPKAPAGQGPQVDRKV